MATATAHKSTPIATLPSGSRYRLPVAWLAPPGDALAKALATAGTEVRPEVNGKGPVFCHPRFAGDLPFVRETLQRLEDLIDLTEPFVRIREAIAEARKMGVTSRN